MASSSASSSPSLADSRRRCSRIARPWMPRPTSFLDESHHAGSPRCHCSNKLRLKRASRILRISSVRCETGLAEGVRVTPDMRIAGWPVGDAASVRERTYAARRRAHHVGAMLMKTKSTLQAPAEATLEGEIAALGAWLTAQGLDLRRENAHEDEGSRDRLYWRYGYFVGLKRALAMRVAGAQAA